MRCGVHIRQKRNKMMKRVSTNSTLQMHRGAMPSKLATAGAALLQETLLEAAAAAAGGGAGGCRESTREVTPWMTTQYDQAYDTCMANGPNMRGNPTAQDSTISPNISDTGSLRETTRLPGPVKALVFAPKSTPHLSRHALGETLHISILCAHNARV